MFKKYVGLLFLWWTSLGFSMTEIKSIDSLEQAIADLKLANQSTLVVFDIDKTLTYEVDVFRQKWFKATEAGQKFCKTVKDYYLSKPNPAEWMALVESTRMKNFRADAPVESMTISIVKMIQQLGAKVIALTACRTGKYGLIDCIEQWRFQQLSDIGIDFSGSFEPQKIVVESLSDKKGRHPIYYKGIILSEEDSIEKGPALGAFLDLVKFRPSKIMFYDDKIINIKSVQAEMIRRSIPFIGYEYKAADKLPRRYNPAVLEYQLNHLQQYGEFMCDEAAEKRCNPPCQSCMPQ